MTAAAGMKSGDSTWVESGYWDVTLNSELAMAKKSRLEVEDAS